VLLVGVGTVWASIGDIKAVTTSDPFLFLRVFTVAREPKPSFLLLMSFLIPLISVGLAFDAINSEFNRRTMSRVLSQPVYRDAVLLGKFLAALGTIAVTLTVLWLLVFGLTLIVLGVPPSTEEVARAFAFLLVTLAYAGVWLAIAILFSVIFRSAATSALCALGLWFVVSVLWSMVVGFNRRRTGAQRGRAPARHAKCRADAMAAGVVARQSQRSVLRGGVAVARAGDTHPGPRLFRPISWAPCAAARCRSCRAS